MVLFKSRVWNKMICVFVIHVLVDFQLSCTQNENFCMSFQEWSVDWVPAEDDMWIECLRERCTNACWGWEENWGLKRPWETICFLADDQIPQLNLLTLAQSCPC